MDVSDNQLKELPVSFSKLRALEYLSLRNNALTDLPEGLQWLTKLQTLDIRGNTIPPKTLAVLRISLPDVKIIQDPAPKK